MTESVARLVLSLLCPRTQLWPCALLSALLGYRLVSAGKDVRSNSLRM